jgi:hypothetical protein
MKIINYLMFFSFVLFFSGIMKGQTVTYSAAESLFTQEQKSVLDKAEKFILRGDKLIKDADGIDTKFEKKKKNEKKFDKKTWEAKKFRIDAEKNYLKAYQDAITVYSGLVVGTEYFDSNDENEAHALNDAALEALTEAESKMSGYGKMGNDEDALKKLSASSLNTAIRSAEGLRLDAYNKEVEAMDIILSQSRKKEMVQKDERAWQNAQDINTIASYQDYIDNFPQGKYVSKARQLIKQLQDEENNKRVVDQSNYIFMVQIAASKVVLSQGKLGSIYKKTKEIQRIYIEGYYKYRVGNFKNYKEAAAFRDQCMRNGAPDAFVVVFDKNGNQIEVTDSMKK